ncbi:MAG: glycosyltransferase family 2 protein [Proteobacteria bacterium]|nr:glycosyltransferase family 2 protein [Pseudomonadota bacterium]
MGEIKLSIVIPCFNEAETISECVKQALRGIELSELSGEVVVANNNSADDSAALAKSAGARVVDVAAKGYGNALIGGIEAACGEYVMMGDADLSYDFQHAPKFVEKLQAGADLVMGNRFLGGIEAGAMPWKNRFVGNPVLSGIGKWLFKIQVGDFHCGLRAFSREAYKQMNLNCGGMEFASEMVIRAHLLKMKVEEVATVLRVDGRSGAPNLRPWRDGLRHLILMLSYNPQKTFKMPGMLLAAPSLVAIIVLELGPARLLGVNFDMGSLMVLAMLFLLGTQLMLMAHLTHCYSRVNGFLLPDVAQGKTPLKAGTLVLAGLFVGLIGALGVILMTVWWATGGFGDTNPQTTMRVLIPAAICLLLGGQLFFNGILQNVLEIPLIGRNK